MQRPLSQVPLSDQSLLVSDVESSLGQRLDDGIVAQQGLCSITLKDEAAGPAVEVCRKQEAGHGRLQVLLLILVCVEGVFQVCWDAVCTNTGRKKRIWAEKRYKLLLCNDTVYFRYQHEGKPDHYISTSTKHLVDSKILR